MPGWINSGNYIGVDLNPGGLSNILTNYTDAINERFDLFASGETKPQYHTAAGDKAVPIPADFVGMEFTEIPQTLDDIEAGIGSLLGFVDFRDPDDLDTQYTTFAQVALDATGSETRPSVNTTDKDLWNFYKDTLSKLYIVKGTAQTTRDESGLLYSTVGGPANATQQIAWNRVLSDIPFREGSFIGMASRDNDVTGNGNFWNWVILDDIDFSYSLGMPAGGTIVQDQTTIHSSSVNDGGSAAVSASFSFSINWTPGLSAEFEVTLSTANILITARSPLLGLSRTTGKLNLGVGFSELPGSPPFLRNEAGGTPTGSTVLYANRAGSPDVAMWIDYASELDFV